MNQIRVLQIVWKPGTLADGFSRGSLVNQVECFIFGPIGGVHGM